MMKKLFLLLFLGLILCGCEKKFTITTTKDPYVINEAEDSAFSEFADDLFVSYLKGSPMDVNFYLHDPLVYGLDEEVYEGMALTIASIEEKEAIEDMIKDIKSFDYASLSKKNRITYEIILDMYENDLNYFGLDYYGTSLGSYLGYQANLPLLLALYRFDDISDVENYLTYLKKAPDDFQAILDFEKAKIDLGLSLPNVILNGVISQCNEVIFDENYFLISTFSSRILDITMSDEKRESLITRNETYVNEYFIEAFKILKDGINEDLLDTQSKSGALCEFGDPGLKYYEYLVKNATGSDESIEQISDNLFQAFSDAFKAFNNIGEDISYSTYKEYENSDMSKGRNYQEMLDFYLNNNAIWKDYPRLEGDVAYNFNIIDESLEDHFSPAAYLTSPIDGNTMEQIIINEKYLEESGGDYKYTVIAHEGIPGHMYQNIYFKNSSNCNALRSLLSFNGYTEGWATYVELNSPKYSGYSKNFQKIYYTEQVLSGYLSAYLDIQIHYYGWEKRDVSNFLIQYGLNYEAASDIYDQLIEIPSNFLEYFYGYYQIVELQKTAKKMLKNYYSDLIFNTFLLDFGPAPFYIIEDHLDDLYLYV